ncbi:conserved Plasmodium protein, unknown function [Plasmodium ovale]|uniref:Uncharacterized protein n=1 Tax=Plasmodium ovale TaxID=36330 RepID=A0A1C3KIA3_PLAOA|nr:conserved Plasmodium protein, unknown function [Plasmodium ovale]
MDDGACDSVGSSIDSILFNVLAAGREKSMKTLDEIKELREKNRKIMKNEIKEYEVVNQLINERIETLPDVISSFKDSIKNIISVDESNSSFYNMLDEENDNDIIKDISHYNADEHIDDGHCSAPRNSDRGRYDTSAEANIGVDSRSNYFPDKGPSTGINSGGNATVNGIIGSKSGSSNDSECVPLASGGSSDNERVTSPLINRGKGGEQSTLSGKGISFKGLHCRSSPEIDISQLKNKIERQKLTLSDINQYTVKDNLSSSVHNVKELSCSEGTVLKNKQKYLNDTLDLINRSKINIKLLLERKIPMHSKVCEQNRGIYNEKKAPSDSKVEEANKYTYSSDVKGVFGTDEKKSAEGGAYGNLCSESREENSTCHEQKRKDCEKENEIRKCVSFSDSKNGKKENSSILHLSYEKEHLNSLNRSNDPCDVVDLVNELEFSSKSAGYEKCFLYSNNSSELLKATSTDEHHFSSSIQMISNEIENSDKGKKINKISRIDSHYFTDEERKKKEKKFQEEKKVANVVGRDEHVKLAEKLPRIEDPCGASDIEQTPSGESNSDKGIESDDALMEESLCGMLHSGSLEDFNYTVNKRYSHNMSKFTDAVDVANVLLRFSRLRAGKYFKEKLAYYEKFYISYCVPITYEKSVHNNVNGTRRGRSLNEDYLKNSKLVGKHKVNEQFREGKKRKNTEREDMTKLAQSSGSNKNLSKYRNLTGKKGRHYAMENDPIIYDKFCIESKYVKKNYIEFLEDVYYKIDNNIFRKIENITFLLCGKFDKKKRKKGGNESTSCMQEQKNRNIVKLLKYPFIIPDNCEVLGFAEIPFIPIPNAEIQIKELTLPNGYFTGLIKGSRVLFYLYLDIFEKGEEERLLGGRLLKGEMLEEAEIGSGKNRGEVIPCVIAKGEDTIEKEKHTNVKNEMDFGHTGRKVTGGEVHNGTNNVKSACCGSMKNSPGLAVDFEDEENMGVVEYDEKDFAKLSSKARSLNYEEERGMENEPIRDNSGVEGNRIMDTLSRKESYLSGKEKGDVDDGKAVRNRKGGSTKEGPMGGIIDEEVSHDMDREEVLYIYIDKIVNLSKRTFENLSICVRFYKDEKYYYKHFNLRDEKIFSILLFSNKNLSDVHEVMVETWSKPPKGEKEDCLGILKINVREINENRNMMYLEKYFELTYRFYNDINFMFRVILIRGLRNMYENIMQFCKRYIENYETDARNYLLNEDRKTTSKKNSVVFEKNRSDSNSFLSISEQYFIYDEVSITNNESYIYEIQREVLRKDIRSSTVVSNILNKAKGRTDLKEDDTTSKRNETNGKTAPVVAHRVNNTMDSGNFSDICERILHSDEDTSGEEIGHNAVKGKATERAKPEEVAGAEGYEAGEGDNKAMYIEIESIKEELLLSGMNENIVHLLVADLRNNSVRNMGTYVLRSYFEEYIDKIYNKWEKLSNKLFLKNKKRMLLNDVCEYLDSLYLDDDNYLSKEDFFLFFQDVGIVFVDSTVFDELCFLFYDKEKDKIYFSLFASLIIKKGVEELKNMVYGYDILLKLFEFLHAHNISIEYLENELFKIIIQKKNYYSEKIRQNISTKVLMNSNVDCTKPNDNLAHFLKNEDNICSCTSLLFLHSIRFILKQFDNNDFTTHDLFFLVKYIVQNQYNYVIPDMYVFVNVIKGIETVNITFFLCLYYIYANQREGRSDLRKVEQGCSVISEDNISNSNENKVHIDKKAHACDHLQLERFGTNRGCRGTHHRSDIGDNHVNRNQSRHEYEHAHLCKRNLGEETDEVSLLLSNDKREEDCNLTNSSSSFPHSSIDSLEYVKGDETRKDGEKGNNIEVVYPREGKDEKSKKGMETAEKARDSHSLEFAHNENAAQPNDICFSNRREKLTVSMLKNSERGESSSIGTNIMSHKISNPLEGEKVQLGNEGEEKGNNPDEEINNGEGMRGYTSFRRRISPLEERKEVDSDKCNEAYLVKDKAGTTENGQFPTDRMATGQLMNAVCVSENTPKGEDRKENYPKNGMSAHYTDKKKELCIRRKDIQRGVKNCLVILYNRIVSGLIDVEYIGECLFSYYRGGQGEGRKKKEKMEILRLFDELGVYTSYDIALYTLKWYLKEAGVNRGKQHFRVCEQCYTDRVNKVKEDEIVNYTVRNHVQNINILIEKYSLHEEIGGNMFSGSTLETFFILLKERNVNIDIFSKKNIFTYADFYNEIEKLKLKFSKNYIRLLFCNLLTYDLTSFNSLHSKLIFFDCIEQYWFKWNKVNFEFYNAKVEMKEDVQDLLDSVKNKRRQLTIYGEEEEEKKKDENRVSRFSHNDIISLGKKRTNLNTKRCNSAHSVEDASPFFFLPLYSLFFYYSEKELLSGGKLVKYFFMHIFRYEINSVNINNYMNRYYTFYDFLQISKDITMRSYEHNDDDSFREDFLKLIILINELYMKGRKGNGRSSTDGASPYSLNSFVQRKAHLFSRNFKKSLNLIRRDIVSLGENTARMSKSAFNLCSDGSGGSGESVVFGAEDELFLTFFRRNRHVVRYVREYFYLFIFCKKVMQSKYTELLFEERESVSYLRKLKEYHVQKMKNVAMKTKLNYAKNKCMRISYQNSCKNKLNYFPFLYQEVYICQEARKFNGEEYTCMVYPYLLILSDFLRRIVCIYKRDYVHCINKLFHFDYAKRGSRALFLYHIENVMIRSGSFDSKEWNKIYCIFEIFDIRVNEFFLHLLSILENHKYVIPNVNDRVLFNDWKNRLWDMLGTRGMVNGKNEVGSVSTFGSKESWRRVLFVKNMKYQIAFNKIVLYDMCEYDQQYMYSHLINDKLFMRYMSRLYVRILFNECISTGLNVNRLFQNIKTKSSFINILSKNFNHLFSEFDIDIFAKQYSFVVDMSSLHLSSYHNFMSSKQFLKDLYMQGEYYNTHLKNKLFHFFLKNEHIFVLRNSEQNENQHLISCESLKNILSHNGIFLSWAELYDFFQPLNKLCVIYDYKMCEFNKTGKPTPYILKAYINVSNLVMIAAKMDQTEGHVLQKVEISNSDISHINHTRLKEKKMVKNLEDTKKSFNKGIGQNLGDHYLHIDAQNSNANDKQYGCVVKLEDNQGKTDLRENSKVSKKSVEKWDGGEKKSGDLLTLVDREHNSKNGINTIMQSRGSSMQRKERNLRVAQRVRRGKVTRSLSGKHKETGKFSNINSILHMWTSNLYYNFSFNTLTLERVLFLLFLKMSNLMVKKKLTYEQIYFGIKTFKEDDIKKNEMINACSLLLNMAKSDLEKTIPDDFILYKMDFKRGIHLNSFLLKEQYRKLFVEVGSDGGSEGNSSSSVISVRDFISFFEKEKTKVIFTNYAFTYNFAYEWVNYMNLKSEYVSREQCEHLLGIFCMESFVRDDDIVGKANQTGEGKKEDRKGRPIHGHTSCHASFHPVSSKSVIKTEEERKLYNLIFREEMVKMFERGIKGKWKKVLLPIFDLKSFHVHRFRILMQEFTGVRKFLWRVKEARVGEEANDLANEKVNTVDKAHGEGFSLRYFCCFGMKEIHLGDIFKDVELHMEKDRRKKCPDIVLASYLFEHTFSTVKERDIITLFENNKQILNLILFYNGKKIAEAGLHILEFFSIIRNKEKKEHKILCFVPYNKEYKELLFLDVDIYYERKKIYSNLPLFETTHREVSHSFHIENINQSDKHIDFAKVKVEVESKEEVHTHSRNCEINRKLTNIGNNDSNVYKCGNSNHRVNSENIRLGMCNRSREEEYDKVLPVDEKVEGRVNVMKRSYSGEYILMKRGKAVSFYRNKKHSGEESECCMESECTHVDLKFGISRGENNKVCGHKPPVNYFRIGVNRIIMPTQLLKLIEYKFCEKRDKEKEKGKEKGKEKEKEKEKGKEKEKEKGKGKEKGKEKEKDDVFIAIYIQLYEKIHERNEEEKYVLLSSSVPKVVNCRDNDPPKRDLSAFWRNKGVPANENNPAGNHYQEGSTGSTMQHSSDGDGSGIAYPREGKECSGACYKKRLGDCTKMSPSKGMTSAMEKSSRRRNEIKWFRRSKRLNRCNRFKRMAKYLNMYNVEIKHSEMIRSRGLFVEGKIIVRALVSLNCYSEDLVIGEHLFKVRNMLYENKNVSYCTEYLFHPLYGTSFLHADDEEDMKMITNNVDVEGSKGAPGGCITNGPISGTTCEEVVLADEGVAEEEVNNADHKKNVRSDELGEVGGKRHEKKNQGGKKAIGYISYQYEIQGEETKEKRGKKTHIFMPNFVKIYFVKCNEKMRKSFGEEKEDLQNSVYEKMFSDILRKVHYKKLVNMNMFINSLRESSYSNYINYFERFFSYFVNLDNSLFFPLKSILTILALKRLSSHFVNSLTYFFEDMRKYFYYMNDLGIVEWPYLLKSILKAQNRYLKREKKKEKKKKKNVNKIEMTKEKMRKEDATFVINKSVQEKSPMLSARSSASFSSSLIVDSTNNTNSSYTYNEGEGKTEWEKRSGKIDLESVKYMRRSTCMRHAERVRKRKRKILREKDWCLLHTWGKWHLRKENKKYFFLHLFLSDIIQFYEENIHLLKRRERCIKCATCYGSFLKGKAPFSQSGSPSSSAMKRMKKQKDVVMKGFYRNLIGGKQSECNENVSTRNDWGGETRRYKFQQGCEKQCLEEHAGKHPPSDVCSRHKGKKGFNEFSPFEHYQREEGENGRAYLANRSPYHKRGEYDSNSGEDSNKSDVYTGRCGARCGEQRASSLCSDLLRNGLLRKKETSIYQYNILKNGDRKTHEKCRSGRHMRYKEDGFSFRSDGSALKWNGKSSLKSAMVSQVEREGYHGHVKEEKGKYYIYVKVKKMMNPLPFINRQKPRFFLTLQITLNNDNFIHENDIFPFLVHKKKELIINKVQAKSGIFFNEHHLLLKWSSVLRLPRREEMLRVFDKNREFPQHYINFCLHNLSLQICFYHIEKGETLLYGFPSEYNYSGLYHGDLYNHIYGSKGERVLIARTLIPLSVLSNRGKTKVRAPLVFSPFFTTHVGTNEVEVILKYDKEHGTKRTKRLQEKDLAEKSLQGKKKKKKVDSKSCTAFLSKLSHKWEGDHGEKGAHKRQGNVLSSPAAETQTGQNLSDFDKQDQGEFLDFSNIPLLMLPKIPPPI